MDILLITFCTGTNRNTICSSASFVLLCHSVCHGAFPVDGFKVFLVLLCKFLFIPVLHVLWNDDNGYCTKSTSGSRHCIIFLYTFRSLLRILYPKTSKLNLYFPDIQMLIFCYNILMPVIFSENSQVVDMVLLDLPFSMDNVWINSITIW